MTRYVAALAALTIGLAAAANPQVYAVVGDTQTWVELEDPSLVIMMEALCDAALSGSVQGVMFTGDMVEHGPLDEYAWLSGVLSILDACSLPYFVIAGNHDHKGERWEDFFRGLAFQPTDQLPLKRHSPLYLHDLGNGFVLVGAPDQGVKAEKRAWVAERIAGKNLIWVQHRCVDATKWGKPRKARKAVRKELNPRLMIGGHFLAKGPKPPKGIRTPDGKKAKRTRNRLLRAWGSRDQIAWLYQNDQYTDVTNGWTTRVELYEDGEVCFQAWNPESGEVSYERIEKFRHESPLPACFLP